MPEATPNPKQKKTWQFKALGITLYGSEFTALILVSIMFREAWLIGFIISLVLGFVIGMLISFILKRAGKRWQVPMESRPEPPREIMETSMLEGPHQTQPDSYRNEVAREVIRRWPSVPRKLKKTFNKLFRCEIHDILDARRVSLLKIYRATTAKVIEARQAAREGDKDKAKRVINEVIETAECYDFQAILASAKTFQQQFLIQ